MQDSQNLPGNSFYHLLLSTFLSSYVLSGSLLKNTQLGFFVLSWGMGVEMYAGGKRFF